MQIPLKNINLDETMQCRAEMRQDAIEDYAESYRQGEELPPVDVYGTNEECWPGDGWHRIMAARKAELTEIEANLHHGGRQEAIQHALNANAQHGVRRTNADKRRAVEIALREFPDKSSRQIAEMCGVGDQLVRDVRDVRDSRTSTVTDTQGRQQPATKPRAQTEPSEPSTPAGPPSEPAGADHTNPEQEPQKKEENAYAADNDQHTTDGRSELDALKNERSGKLVESWASSLAEVAISQLKRISEDDPGRDEALQMVIDWAETNKRA